MKKGGERMVQDLFDEKITKALKNGTKQSSEAVHEENLQSILHKIHEIDKGERKMPKRKSAWGKVVSIATAAAVMLIVLGTYTQPGQAAWEKIREYFEPEKKVETEIEGSKETVDTRLQQSDMGYVIYYDQDRYKIEEDGEIDRIVTKEAYEGIVAKESEYDLLNIVESRPIVQWRHLIKNDFEENVFKNHPQLKEIKDKLYDIGALYAQMSGSGSTIYGIFDKDLSEDEINLFKYPFVCHKTLK